MHSFNMSLPKIAPEGGLTIAGEYFEAGVRAASCVVGHRLTCSQTILSVSNYALHYNKNIFGADVDVFRPERYLEQGGSKLSEFVIPFSVGHRACIGRKCVRPFLLTEAAVDGYAQHCSNRDPQERLDSFTQLYARPARPARGAQDRERRCQRESALSPFNRSRLHIACRSAVYPCTSRDEHKEAKSTLYHYFHKDGIYIQLGAREDTG